MVFIGCDPGKEGFICVISERRKLLESYPMPLCEKEEVSFKGLLLLFRDLKEKHKDCRVWVEEISDMWAGSKQTCFQLGKNYKSLLDAIEVSNFDYNLIAPKEWQQVVQEKQDFHYEEVLNKKTGKVSKKKDSKQTTINAIKRIFPRIDLQKTNRSRTDHDGKADATAIAYYGFLSWKNYENKICKGIEEKL